MIHRIPTCARVAPHHLLAAAVVCTLVAGNSGLLWAQSQDAVRIEEDWQLVVSDPAEAKASPQFETVMSPFGHTDTAYARITWNYLELPSFTAGGLQLQAWNGDSVLFENHLDLSPLSANNETISWTQVLETNQGALRFQITNGHAPSQPEFSSADLIIQGGAGLSHLNAYNTGLSVAKSGITFGGNRVVSLRIVGVRKYNAEGDLISNDTSAHTIHGE